MTEKGRRTNDLLPGVVKIHLLKGTVLRLRVLVAAGAGVGRAGVAMRGVYKNGIEGGTCSAVFCYLELWLVFLSSLHLIIPPPLSSLFKWRMKPFLVIWRMG